MEPNLPNTQTPSTVQDPLRIPRRQLDPEDILDIVRRNRSWLAGPALAGLVIAVVVAFLWPDTYVSSAVIRIVPPQVPSSLVPTNVTTRMTDRINSMAQTILSRGTLTSIIETYGLYARERSSLPMEDIIEKMRRDIKIGDVRSIRPGRGGNLTAFQVSFAYENRYLAQKVTSDLVSRFTSENTRERANQSQMTTQFLKDQLQSAKNELDAIEQKLTDFRVKNAGQLPDQWRANMQQLNAMETRIATLNGAIGRLNQEKLMLESEMRIDRENVKQAMKIPTADSPEYVDGRLVRLNEQIRVAEKKLALLLDNYTPNHPDVKRYESQIELLRKQRQEYIHSRQGETPEKAQVPTLTPAQAAEIRRLNENIQKRQIEIRAKDLEIQTNVKAIKELNKRIAVLQHKMEVAPVGEQEYASLLRDHELAKKRYDDLNLKMAQSAIATDLENRKQGETLELLDPASLPEKPTQPIRSAIILAGLFLGISIGGALVFLREMKDTSLKTLKDVRAYTQLVILGSIPLLENDLVVMRRRRMAWLAWTTACVFSVVVMAGSIYYYYAAKD